jgi:hypothetical protein
MPTTLESPDTAIHGDHGGHTMEHGSVDDDCGHCPPGEHGASGDCNTLASAECGSINGIAVDNRSVRPDTDDLPDDTKSIVSSVDPPPVQAPRILKYPPWRQYELPAGPPLNIQFCVFLK